MTGIPQSQKSDSFTSQQEKDALLTSLTSTMQDVWRLPWLIFAPVIAYVSAHFAKIPEERKSHLKNILDEIKAGWNEWVGKLKDRFKGMLWWPSDDKKTTKWGKTPAKKTATKSASAKKTATKKPTSRTDKISSATKSVTDKAKSATQKAAAATSTKKKPVAKATAAKKPAPKKK